MPIYSEEIDRLLFEDDDGEEVGLGEVQLLDPSPMDRVAAVKLLLNTENLLITFDAILLLCAWGEDEGLAYVEVFVDKEMHRVAEFSPHRVYGFDNMYDDLAYAVYLYGCTVTGKVNTQNRILGKILDVYGHCQFDSQLKYALLDGDYRSLYDKVWSAIHRSLAENLHFQASQLLPVAAKWNPLAAWSMVPYFLSLDSIEPSPLLNVAEGLRYIETKESVKLLRELSANPDELVRSVAKESLGETEY